MRKRTYLQYLKELAMPNKEGVLYHGDALQNMRLMRVRPAHGVFPEVRKKLKKDKVIFATPQKPYAACYGWEWNDEMDRVPPNFDIFYDDKGVWNFGISKKWERILYDPMSIYILPYKGFEEITDLGKIKEWVIYDDVEVISEERYDTWLDAMKNNGVVVKLT